MITKLLAVVPVRDIDAAADWYERFFQRPADARPMPSLADWHLTDQSWVQVYADAERAGRTQLNFAVDDLDSDLTDLDGRGFEFGEVLATDKGARISATSDPDGNVLSLIENPST